ncbi:MAG: caspase family protein, partial [Siculibacillus sp.]|nr:caspase family protein [Siculibacillus sp.]
MAATTLPIPRTRTRARLGAAAAMFLASTAMASAEPQTRALLIGVSNYPKETVGDLQLAGPKNDVALMIETLARIGVPAKNVTVLADGLETTTANRPADGMPTRAAILAALDRLAAESGPGDFVLLHLSGHGSQQPMTDPARSEGAKADGLEEIFLPIDIGAWEDSIGAVKNALVDHELGRAVTAIRAKGARVWVVVDACHSGTMTRAGGDAVAKQVPPATLRIPEAALVAARARAAAAVPP